MEMSDSDGSDNEMFSCKQEYNSFKQHFSSKESKTKKVDDYGNDLPADGGEPASEYGGGSERLAVVGSKFGHVNVTGATSKADANRQTHYDRRSERPSGDTRIAARPVAYDAAGNRPVGDKERKRSRSRERSRRSRSREGREGGGDLRRGDTERGVGGGRGGWRGGGGGSSGGWGGRDRSRERRRSRSRERDGERRDQHGGRGGLGRDRGRGGWGRDRGREEGARNHEEQVRKAKEMGVDMPKYFKPGAVNPLSYAEQVQKRKMMWSKPASAENKESKPEVVKEKPEEVSPASVGTGGGSALSYNKWETTNFGNDQANEKFRRLMGIKSKSNPTDTNATAAPPDVNHDKIQDDLEQNYEAARQQTHRNRGLGLGFSSMEYRAPLSSASAAEPAAAARPFQGNGTWPHLGAQGLNFVKKQ